MKNIVLFMLAGISCILFACEPATKAEDPKPDLGALRAEVQQMEDGYAKASNEKNVDAILAFYSDDAQRLPDGAPTVKGKNDLRKQIQEEMAADSTDSNISFKVEDIFTEGNLLVEVGSSTWKPKDGEARHGKYIAVYEKRDGKWLCVRDIWNSDTDDDDDDDDDDKED